ncbi:unnamed protein product [Didymodactylos carnosus]|uniref:Kinesin light chain n=1 Tax=Didymodactylos carnosus TaxID=1234261 RepID=A0A8S2JLC0_9BILA|nr:unnamed protein product [Didymodactylos carnosus]CAF3804279.1 unnamed protein product [Didymodactylos carnosus]
MTLCSDNDHDLKSIFGYSKARLEAEGTSLYSLGQVLRDMGKFDAAEKYIPRFLNQLPPNHRDVALCCHALGVIIEENGDYDLSLQWHQKSLEMWVRTLTSNDPTLGDAHNCVAVVYRKKGDYKRALDSNGKALMIFRQTFGDDHLKIAMCFNNIGVVYYEDKKYLKALEYYQKALVVWQKHLPANHSHLEAAYNNIGEVHRYLDQYDLALKKGDMKQALILLDKAAVIFRHALPPTNSDVIRIGQNIE